MVAQWLDKVVESSVGHYSDAENTKTGRLVAGHVVVPHSLVVVACSSEVEGRTYPDHMGIHIHNAKADCSVVPYCGQEVEEALGEEVEGS